MNLLDFFRNLFGRREAADSGPLSQLAKVVKYIGFSFSPGRDRFEAPPIDFFELTRAYSSDGYIRQALNKHINLMFKAGWTLAGKNDKAVRYVKSRLNLMALATGVPVEQFFVGIAEDLVKYANVFLAKARVRGGFNIGGVRARPVVSKKGVVGAYFRMHPGTVSIERDENGKVIRYRQQVGVNRKDFDPDDVIHIYLNREAGMAFGVPFLYPAIEDVRLLRQVEENVALLIYRHIFPFLHYKVGIAEPGKEGTDEEIQAVIDEIQNMPPEGMMVTSERHSIEPIRISTLNAEPYLDYFENRVFADLGVSQVAMGRGDTSSRATADSILGQMQDQVKAMQKVMAAFVDLYIIGELLLEGGFDIVDSENDVDFVFNEIDMDSLIKKENHEVFKFEHNAQTWEEMRRNLGLETQVDESRLYYRMISIPLAQARALGFAPSTDDTDNRNEPQNRHSGEFLETAGLQRELGCATAAARLRDIYRQAEGDVLVAVRQHYQNVGSAFPQPQPVMVQGIVELAFDQMKRYILAVAQEAFSKGNRRAAEDLGMPVVGAAFLVPELRLRLYFYLDRVKADLWGLIQSALKEPDAVQALSLVSGAFQSTAYRLSALAANELPLAYNYSYAVVARQQGKSLRPVLTPDPCPVCASREDTVVRPVIGDLPPWHPYCGCTVRVIS